MSQIVKFKENADLSRPNLGLEKEGRSKFPGCVDIIQPPLGRDGRWKTGLDEKSITVLSILDSVEREATIAKIKKERQDLEELTGYDLSGLSQFWHSFFVEINPSQPLDLAVPIDRIKYHVVIASGSAAPSLKDCSDAKYFTAKYYISKEYDDVGGRLEKKKKYNKAVTALDKLVKTPDKAIQVGRFLDLHMNSGTPQDNIYDMFQVYLDNDEKLGSVDRFIAAISKTPEEIGIKLVFADAIKLGVIRQRDGYFQRGDITMGRSPEDVLSFLSDIKNSGELLSIQEDIDRKSKFG